MNDATTQLPSANAKAPTTPTRLSELLRVLIFGSFALSISLSLLTSCAKPFLEVETTPHDALLFVDGVAKHVDPKHKLENRRVRLAYYGIVSLSIRQRGERSESDRRAKLLDTRQLVEIDPPFSPWMFPLDFILECTTYPFAGDRYDHAISIRLPPRPKSAIGTPPPSRDIDDVTRDADAALIGR